VTVEELRAYQQACEDWMTNLKQKELFQHLLKTDHLGAADMMLPQSVGKWLQSEVDKLNKERSEHPFPKLIPSV
jgi:hypothetical protein